MIYVFAAVGAVVVLGTIYTLIDHLLGGYAEVDDNQGLTWLPRSELRRFPK